MKGLNGKVSDLEKAAAQRKAKLDENSAFLQFNWKADVVESWIGERCRRPHVAQPSQQACPGPAAPPLPLQWVFFCRGGADHMWAESPPPGHTPGGNSRSQCPHPESQLLTHTGPWPGKEAVAVTAATNAHRSRHRAAAALPLAAGSRVWSASPRAGSSLVWGPSGLSDCYHLSSD